MAWEGNPKCFGHEARILTFAWCSVVYTNKQLDDSDVEAIMTCLEKEQMWQRRVSGNPVTTHYILNSFLKTS